MMEEYNYDGARTLLEAHTSDMLNFPSLQAKYNEVVEVIDSLKVWDDLGDVMHLSFHNLIVEPVRAFADSGYGSTYRSSHITCAEFSAMLGELYANGYVLIDLEDMVTISETADGGLTFTTKSLMLPQGKKPFMITETNVNYYAYMVDGNRDGIPDKNGAGFASKLVVDSDGNLTAQYISPNGETLLGDFELVPILERFIQAHPDFSYKGARATIALTGYDGLFGYRTDPETAEKISQDYYEQQLADVKAVIQAVKDAGYDLACYTYDMATYGEMELEAIEQDLTLWKEEVTPLLGEVDILVYPNGSDILGKEAKYSGNIYDYLRNQGFYYFIGQESTTRAWGQITENYMRQTRRQMAPNIMSYSYTYFDDVFNGQAVLDEARGEIPY
jgi:hypothetical protein